MENPECYSDLPLNTGNEFLKPTFFFDTDSPVVEEFARNVTEGAQTDVEKAIKLFYAVRDCIRYDPYNVPLNCESYKASRILKSLSAFCVPKAIVLTAAARAAGIPALIGHADVRNHLTTEKLRERMGTDIFTHHGFSVLYVNGKWLKVTPAFNIELCEKFNVCPLEFDGTSDALFHPFDAGGRRHMEYIRYHGNFPDFPFERFMDAMAKFYPQMMESIMQEKTQMSARFEDEKPLAE